MSESRKLSGGKARRDTNSERQTVYVEDTHYPSGPNPTDFANYFPLACAQLQCAIGVVVDKVEADKYVKPTSKSKVDVKTASSTNVGSQPTPPKAHEEKKAPLLLVRKAPLALVRIIATYSGEFLTKLIFCQNDHIPREIIKILGLIVKFYPKLTTIVINKGLNNYVLYEISAILREGFSNLSALYFDGCSFPRAHFHLLLDPTSHLTELSLARCKVGDEMLRQICEKLVYPSPCSKTLAVLLLPTTNITDVGAKHLGHCLRSNRALKYINLADNHITDVGVKAILTPLKKFTLTEDEDFECSKRFIVYLRNRDRLINDFLSSFKSKTDHHLNQRMHSIIKKKHPNDDVSLYRRAEIFAVQSLGEFIDPFAPCTTEDGRKISDGNTAISYLNFSYNHLTIISLQEILEVLKYQKKVVTGIINLRLDGNPLPNNCQELTDINHVIEHKLSHLTKTRHDKSGKRKG